MISCLLFDLDGTLFDSHEANIAAYSQAFSEAGIPFDAETFKANFGLRFDSMMDVVAPDTTSEQRSRIKEFKVKTYAGQLDLIKPNEALLDFARSAKPHYKLALVTTASKRNVTNLLEHFLGSEQLFDIVITGEDVRQGKPDPECYLKAMKEFGVSGEDCLVFEDTAIGAEAGQKAGAQVIKVVT